MRFTTKKIGIIGAGKVGVTLGKHLSDAGITITGFYSRTKQSAAMAADFIQTRVYETLEEIVSASDTLFITTGDEAIGKVWDCIANYDLTDKIICHFSGSLSSNVFSNCTCTGAVACSIHPMYAFSDKFHSYQNFTGAYVVIEGDGIAVREMGQLFGEVLGHPILHIKPEDKIKYHAAAAMVSNDMIGLFQMVLNLLGECGFSQEDSRNLLRPLVEGNVKSMLEKGPVDSLTGPIERNDIQTVSKHLEALKDPDTKLVYKKLGLVLTDVAKRKHPDRDETAMKTVLYNG